jgi:hypothetical protein
LAVSSWRALYSPCELTDRWGLIAELKNSSLTERAGVARVMLGDDTATLPLEAANSPDPDIAFTAAIITGDIDRLTAAAFSSDLLKQFAAASKLSRLGALGPISNVLRSTTTSYQLQLLKEIEMRRKPAPALRGALFDILEATNDPDIRRYACYVLCYGCPPEDGVRLARAALGERSVYQAILQRAGLPPDRLEELGEFFIDNNVFSAGQWGMDAIAKEGRMPPGFVPRHWTNADDATRIEFCRFAETQLHEYSDEGLHRFMANVIFGTESFDVTLAAWTSLYRWYGRSDHSGMGPLRIQSEPLKRFFGSESEFLRIFNRFLRRPDLPKIADSSSNRDHLAKFLRYAEPDVLPAFTADPRATGELMESVANMMHNQEFDFILRLAGADVLALLGSEPKLRKGAEGLLQPFRGTDLDLASKTAMERITRSHG